MTMNGLTFDEYTRQDWIELLDHGAYRGHHIHAIAKRLKKARSCYYDQRLHQLEVITQFGKRLILDLEKSRDDRRFSLSRLYHDFRMLFSKSAYAVKFNTRITNLADTIITKKANAFGLKLEGFVNEQRKSYSFSQIEAFFMDNLKGINASTGNKEVRENLLKLCRKIRKKSTGIEPEVIASIIEAKASSI